MTLDGLNRVVYGVWFYIQRKSVFDCCLLWCILKGESPPLWNVRPQSRVMIVDRAGLHLKQQGKQSGPNEVFGRVFGIVLSVTLGAVATTNFPFYLTKNFFPTL